MTKNFHQALGCALVLLALSWVAPPLPAQGLTDTVVTVAYLNVKPEQTNAWVSLFKKHWQGPLEELRQQGLLRAWHLFVPAVHHPGYTWTHALALAYKDRAAQAIVEKKLQEILAAMPAEDSKAFFGAFDRDKHFDDEWYEVDLTAGPAPEQKKAEEKK